MCVSPHQRLDLPSHVCVWKNEEKITILYPNTIDFYYIFIILYTSVYLHPSVRHSCVAICPIYLYPRYISVFLFICNSFCCIHLSNHPAVCQAIRLSYIHQSLPLPLIDIQWAWVGNLLSGLVRYSVFLMGCLPSSTPLPYLLSSP